MRRVVASVVGMALLPLAVFIPAWADTPNCFSMTEWQDIKTDGMNGSGWHRSRVRNHADVRPDLVDGNIDHWFTSSGCSGERFTITYKYVHHQFESHWHTVEKCFSTSSDARCRT